MKAKIDYNGKKFLVNFSAPIDISLSLSATTETSVRAFGLPDLHAEPYQVGSFIGSVAQGGPCNCDILTLAPHGHGTHTECVGHIAKEQFSINKALHQFMCFAQLVSISPTTFSSKDFHNIPQQELQDISTYLREGDSIITEQHLQESFSQEIPQAVVIRTKPNNEGKKDKNYSQTNPTYFTPQALQFLADNNVQHLLTDLPSVDKEDDGGLLSAHHKFWQYPDTPRMEATITELVYIPNNILDGLYLLNMQIAPIESDASPSKPILYTLSES